MELPHYNFKELFCFSDEEGGNPFRFTADVGELVTCTTDLDIPALLNDKFTFSADGLLINLKDPNVALGFLGDLVDNESYSIRVLQSMINLKTAHPERVLLIGGNRDFNKIRMGIELYIHDAESQVPWIGVSTMPALLERLASPFTFRQTEVPEYLKGVLKPWNDAMDDTAASPAANGKPEIKFGKGLVNVYRSGNITDRVNVMYGKTLGAQLPKTKDELNDIFGLHGIRAEVEAKLICTFQMLMAFEWNDVPTFLQPYNGLYIKYLRACHVIATFTINGKTGIMSHGGLPHDFEENGELKRLRLTTPFGFLYTEDTRLDSLLTILNEIEGEKNVLIDEVNHRRDSGYDNSNSDTLNDLIDKFVHLTALTNLPDGASSGTSPIVGMQPVPINNRRGDVLVKLRGGAATGWISRQKERGIRRLADGGDLISYDIFGHAPQGFLPTAYREKKTLYVNLDVSKIDGQANNVSFAFLHIDETKTEFIGRIKFTDNPITTIYQPSTEYLKGKLHYYKEPILNLHLPGRQIPMPATVSVEVGKDFKRTIKYTAAGGQRKKTRRNLKKNRRKSRKH